MNDEKGFCFRIGKCAAKLREAYRDCQYHEMEKKLKVLQINSVCGIGSTGKIAADLSCALKEKGNESLICFGRNEGKGFDQIYKICSDFSVKLHFLKSFVFDKHGLGSKFATKRLIQRIKIFSPDIIHLHNIHGYYVNYEKLFCFLKSYNKPVVWTLHDCWAFTGHCAYFDYVGCNKWLTGCYNCSQKKEYPRSLIFDRSKNNYELKQQVFNRVKKLMIVTPSEWLSALVEKSFLGKNRILTINNGIDTNVFKTETGNSLEKLGIGDKKVILGVAAVWEKRKGLKDFFKLNSLISDEYKIVLIGLMKGQITELPKGIVGIKRTENVRELAQIYSESYVLFNPTYEDNYPTVNLEAAACGLPIITYDTGGSPESAVGGYVIKKGDVESAYKIIKAELTRKTLEKDVSKEKMVEEYLKLYCDVAGNDF